MNRSFIIVTLCSLLVSCSSSYRMVPNLDQWSSVKSEERALFLKDLSRKAHPAISLRHRINLITPLDKRSFEQVFIAKNDLYSLSFYAPAYIKLLYRIVNGAERDILIDYQSQAIYELNAMNSISLGDETLTGVGRLYPEVLRGELSNETLGELKESKIDVKVSVDHKFSHMEVVNDGYVVEYLFEQVEKRGPCLREAYVRPLLGSGGVSYKGTEFPGGDCISSRITIKSDSSSAYLEAILLIKQDKIKESPNPFATENPAGFIVK